jgi:hypothetical protein
MSLLVVAWVGVALGISSQLPSGDEPSERGPASGVRRWQATLPIRINKVNPCTGDPLVLEATLSLELTAVLEAVPEEESAQVAVDAILVSGGSGTGLAQLVPIRERFGYHAPLYGPSSHVHELRARLAGQPRSSDLVVALQHRAGRAEQVVLEPYGVWLACTSDPD